MRPYAKLEVFQKFYRLLYRKTPPVKQGFRIGLAFIQQLVLVELLHDLFLNIIIPQDSAIDSKFSKIIPPSYSLHQTRFLRPLW